MTLAHDVTGDGPAVLLLHSTVVDRRMWDPTVPALVEAGFQAIRCDLRGYGDSPPATELYNDADDALDLLGTDPFTIIGSSGGGRVALEIAARYPGLVTALVLLCSAGDNLFPGPGLRAFWDRENALLEAGDIDGAVDLNVTQWVGPEASDQTRDSVRVMQRHVFDLQMAVPEEPPQTTYEYDYADIAARMLLVTGAHDFPEFGAVADDLAAVHPSATRVHLPWAGHLPSMERPDLLNPILLEFLK
ncbi:alpha/beta fold hydrolase [Actinoplanes sp. CA-142083]|uniref:alpha/beta fold hydrolase n=1 Tax=Actinoplanes sp. CA-142083 TaxID=3239903 RepID=UPI003D8EB3C5